jgi:pimeloyl-ACP methyl ester carboxylesterase
MPLNGLLRDNQFISTRNHGMTLRLPVFFALLAFVTCLHAKTEFGTHDNAEFRIDIPENWNHGLVVYYHGYDAENHGMGFDETKPLAPNLIPFTAAGFAVIQSGFSRGGWALEQAIPETEALRRYFIEKYGNPTETYVAGQSMGGMLTVMTLEQDAADYAGGLDMCGAVEDTTSLIGRAFDGRVIFDYYFPGALPNPSKVPADYTMSEHLSKKLAHLLETKPQGAATLRHWLGAHNNKDLVGALLFGTWVLMDIEQRAGGNPFDNRNTIYTGSPNDNALNNGVKRYSGGLQSLVYLQRYYTPTGHLPRPVLALHTTYDILVSPSTPGKYYQLTRATGASDLFVVQYVKHEGHCNFTSQEITVAFDELRRWAHDQKVDKARPHAGWLNVPATVKEAKSGVRP